MSVRCDVDRGLEIVVQIEALKKELEAIEDRLEAAGLKGEQIELMDPEREGRQYLAHGSECVVPVVFTADLLVKTFQKGSAVHQKIEAAAGTSAILASFFKESVTFKSLFDSGKIFRRQAEEILGEQAGPKFITACLARDKQGIPKSAVKIEWERAEVTAKEEGV